MSKKRLSADDKKRLLLQLLHEKKDVFQLKDLERIASKEKGIVAQSVKEVLSSLVDDSLVDSEKIGTSVYFWSFPTKAYSVKKAQTEEIEDKIRLAKGRMKELDIKLATTDPDHVKKKEEKIEQLKSIKEEIGQLKQRLQENSMEEEIKELKEKTNLWTDNIFSIKSFVRNKLNLEEQQLNKQFNIPQELDYVE